MLFSLAFNINKYNVFVFLYILYVYNNDERNNNADNKQ